MMNSSRPPVCIACKSSSTTDAFPVSDWNFLRVNEVDTMVRCTRCRSLFPLKAISPDVLHQAYSAYYTTKSQLAEFAKIRKKISTIIRKRYLSRGYHPRYGQKILDYGCGSGAFLDYISELYPSSICYGTDIYKPEDADKAENYKWLTMDELESHNCQFDYVTLSHVLEHLDNPYDALATLRSVLTPAGVLWISTPNSNSYLISSFHGRSRDIDYPRHRHIYSAQAIAALLDKSGYKYTFMKAETYSAWLNHYSCLSNLTKRPFLKDEPHPQIFRSIINSLSLPFVLQLYGENYSATPELIIKAVKA